MTIKVTWEPGYDRLPRLQWEFDAASMEACQRFGLVNELTAGENVFEQGKPSDALYIVLEGEVAIVKAAEELARVTEGLSFGEMGLLMARPRGATARAIVDSKILELGRHDLDEMMEDDPRTAARLYRVLAETLAEYLAISSEE